MTTVSLAEAKARLSTILDRVEAGETFVITRHGRPVAQVSAAASETKSVFLEELAAFRATMPTLPESGVAVLRALRDESL
ncbi:type II toxin-antitoxin system prevent-host-death family antitoxin [Aquibium sp. ELW1220]|jgi:prevent-host-death family protein|uniref:type II toxin-antitoxin system Phd/YefM family antitoxin n=1 Tax=Aquibium sp. ELW1220 TaxID=2976766 RepID=UPI0025B020BF|nr:type II toxin-antitoxin system prevent-host-death family antitoxin [Aquibium sp. ELW1220]MDN2583714.1 type II toxin-antitoxin system prevent-host-death family antitoxin [Aquibium sp. ELW1220]